MVAKYDVLRMTTTAPGHGASSDEAVARLADLAAARPGGSSPELLRAFARAALSGTEADDLAARGEHDVLGALWTHWDLGWRRQAHETQVQVVAPERGSRSWRTRHAAVMIVTDDAPFLVDTVRMALDRLGLQIHLMVHPILRVRRNKDGEVTGFPDRGGVLEAWTLMEVDHCDDVTSQLVRSEIEHAVEQVHRAVGDFDAMRGRVGELVAYLEGSDGDQADEAHSAARLFDWLTRRHFVFLGGADYGLVDGELVQVEGSGLGLWRGPHDADPPFPGDGRLLSISRTNAHSPVHRPVKMTCLSVRVFDEHGEVSGVRRLVGLFSSAAYRESVTEIPLLREHVAELNRRAGFPADSHSGRALRDTLESFPRDTLFEVDIDVLAEVVLAIVALQERQVVRVFAIVGPGARYATVLVYLPKARFAAGLSGRIAQVVAERFDATGVEQETFVGGGMLARITVTVETAKGPCVVPDLDALANEIDALTITWRDRVADALAERLGEEHALTLLDRFADGIPAPYEAAVEPTAAVDDLVRLARLVDGGGTISSATSAPPSAWVGVTSDHRRFRVIFTGEALPLSDLLPVLEQLGLVVLDQRPYLFRIDGRRVWLFDVGVRLPAGVELSPRLELLLHQVFADLVEGRVESDGFNRLVLLAGLTGRQVEVLRGYAKYLRQIGFPFSQSYIEAALARHPHIAADLVALFDNRFDPHVEGNREILVDALRSEILAALDAVPSLDDDRVGRIFLALVEATLRTNVFRPAGDGGHRPVMSFKLDPARLPDVPLPLPAFEIFVCSPRVEGVHLRGGPIARGGLRASDRREDFRTEILGLMKAQMVKNALIVPMGAKGGFVLKRPPTDPVERRVEVAACYRQFVSGMLDVTDNIVEGQVVPPLDTVRYDGDDPYLVVAADKGTATFSDLANEISAEYGFWLGDAFASGGSAGYDHKEMGITARGAWEAVRRHARALGKDADRDELTVVGVGDMSGDVFGNGMLLSSHLRLVAAFDHRHIFLDPEPDPAASFAERRRLFELPGSSWADYDASLISAGGGVHPRTAKSIRLTPEVQRALDVSATALAPTELISAILRAPVDLLWNGGIGTYVKASNEVHAEAGDRANDVLRIDATELRCRMVAEGGNLGFTQRARVEYALGGGLINTDAIDNSAGVDCSDHEVNLKILLDGAIRSGALREEDRNDLLAEMTDDVAALVLSNNQAQTLALTIARSQAFPMVSVHARYLQLLEAEGWLNRSLEFLPSDKELGERQAGGRGLTVPEFAVMLAYTKWADTTEVLASDLPDDPYLMPDLVTYFPRAVRERFGDAIAQHRLRREIVATTVVNQMVNLQGISFDHRMTEETGLPVSEVCRAWVAARDIFELPRWWQAIDDLGSGVPLDTEIEMFFEARRMVERATLWLLRRGLGRDIHRAVAEHHQGVAELAGVVHEVLTGDMAAEVDARAERWIDAGVPDDLARRAATWPIMHVGLDLVELAHRHGRPIATCVRAYWEAFDALGVSWLWQHISHLPRADRWASQARSAVRDDLLGALAAIADSVLSTGRSAEAWCAAHERPVARMTSILREIQREGEFGLTTLTVAVRQLQNLALAERAEAAAALRQAGDAHR